MSKEIKKAKNICLIPARGGSKRIPKKNIIDFCGKPLIAHTIEVAMKSKLFKEIYISSDSEEILKISSRYKVQQIKRPTKLASSNALLENVTLHLLNNIPDNFDYLCLLMPNCPLRLQKDIKKSYQKLIKSKANCLMSVVDYHWLNPFWAMQEKNNHLKMLFGNKYFVNNFQKLPQDVYCPTGVVRWVKISNFLKEKKYYGKDLIKYEVPFERAVDIDTYKDLELAKKFYKILK